MAKVLAIAVPKTMTKLWITPPGKDGRTGAPKVVDLVVGGSVRFDVVSGVPCSFHVMKVGLPRADNMKLVALNYNGEVYAYPHVMVLTSVDKPKSDTLFGKR